MPARLRAVTLCALYGALSVAFCLPLFDQPTALGVNDWDQHLFYYGSVVKSVVEYGQLPFWNPWYCGGNVLWQNPQIALLSPVYPLTAVMSLQLAMKVNIVLHYWLGFVGMHVLLTRVIGFTFLPGVIYLATLVTASGAPAIHLRAGHSVFLPGFYLPLQLFFFFRAYQSGAWRDIFLSAATLALMVFNGGTHILPMSFAALGTFAIVGAIAKREWRPLILVTVFTIAGLAYSAPKLLPVGLFVSGERFWDTRNPTEHPDRMTLPMLRQTYLVPTQDVGGRLPEQRHGWHEYGNYIGPVGVLAITLGWLWALARLGAWGLGLGKSSSSLKPQVSSPPFGWALVLTTLMMLALSLGEFSRFAPATLSAHLPLFSSFRIPSRYTIVFVQFGVLTLAWACRGLTGAVWMRAVVGVLCLATAGHLIVTNRETFSRVFSEPAFDTSFPRGSGPSQITTDNDSSAYTRGSPMLRALVEDRAFFNCYESLQTFRTAVADQSQVFLEGPATVAQRFTPNRVAFSMPAVEKPTRVYLNYNWSPGWRSTAGAVDGTSKEAMAFVVMPPGPAAEYSFSFVPPGLVFGTVIFLLSIAVSVLVIFRSRRSRPHRPSATR